MTILHLNPLEVLIPDFIDEYNKGITYFSNELTILTTILFFTKKLLDFPFRLFGKFDDLFFPIIARSFYIDSILLITKLVSGRDSFTLKKFANQMKQYMVKEQYRNQVIQSFSKERLEEKIIKIENGVKKLRDKKIAHMDFSAYKGNIKILYPSFTKIQEINNELCGIFTLLTFGKYTEFLPFNYYQKNGMNTDIELILDSFAESSYILNLPENEPKTWPITIRQLSACDIENINRYREKFGLPKIELGS